MFKLASPTAARAHSRTGRRAALSQRRPTCIAPMLSDARARGDAAASHTAETRPRRTVCCRKPRSNQRESRRIITKEGYTGRASTGSEVPRSGARRGARTRRGPRFAAARACRSLGQGVVGRRVRTPCVDRRALEDALAAACGEGAVLRDDADGVAIVRRRDVADGLQHGAARTRRDVRAEEQAAARREGSPAAGSGRDGKVSIEV